MGSSCGISSKKSDLDQVILPTKSKKILKSSPPPDESSALIGKFYSKSTNPQLNTWKKILLLQESTQKSSKLQKSLKTLSFQGIPSEYRWRIWSNLIIHEKLMTEQQYLHLPTAPEPYPTTIKRDLDRSFPSEAYFDKSQYGVIGQAALERVLSKYAASVLEVGYCQGMNFIAGFLLLVSGGSEIEVFHFISSLFSDFSLHSFFSEGFEGLKQYVWVCKKLIQKYRPKVFYHLADQSIPDDLWLLKWLMTLFTMVLPGQVLVRIWDVLLIKGKDSVFSVILAILQLIEEELLSKDSGEICVYLSEIRLRIKDPDELLKAVKSVKVSKGSIEKLVKEYRESNKGSPGKMLTTGEDFKLPPLKVSPHKKVRAKSESPNGFFSSRAINADLKPYGNNRITISPSGIQSSRVPVLPDIKRTKMRRLSFGIHKRSCDMTWNCENSF